MVRQPASQRAVAQNEINKDNMKIIRNIARRPWPRIGGWLPVMMLICGVLASCSSEDESTAPLPDGKYPLQLTAEVAQPQTRAGGKDAWTGGEEIRVSLEGVFGNKTYVMDASGNASPKDADNAFYWKNTDEARVSAWTPDIESETDISDQSGGYAAFDVLYASAIGRYDQAINLRFIHRMAKIEVILKAGEGITEEELEGATVTIFGDPLTHSTAGLVSPGDQSDGEIKPYYDAATKKYEALVPPQDMTGKPLIRISIGSNDFTYTPETEAAGKFGFFGGKRYAYTITVKASGIEVTAAKGGTWNAGGSENVGVTITYDGTETEPKSATITTPTAPGETVACASSMPTARWSGQRPSRSRRTVRTLSPSCSMPVITKTMPPITPPPVSVSRSATAMPLPCRMPQTVIVSGAFTEPSWVAAPRMEAEKNRTITLHLTSTGAATPGHRKSSPLPAARTS